MLFNHMIEDADRCGNLLASSRTRAELSRKTMSNTLGVSESTIKAWENGQGSPTLSGILEWFRTVGESPFRPMMDFFWPDVFAGLTAQNTDDEIREAGKFYFANVAGPKEIQKLHYLIFGKHGSEWSGLLDMACAHTHTSLNSRYRVAEIIQVSYEMSAANGLALKPPEIEADRPLLLSAIAAAKEASVSFNKNGYTIVQSNTDISALLAKARMDSGATQKELAKALGKTVHTIQKWETNYDPPFLDLCTWFRVLNMPAWTYIHDRSKQHGHFRIAGKSQNGLRCNAERTGKGAWENSTYDPKMGNKLRSTFFRLVHLVPCIEHAGMDIYSLYAVSHGAADLLGGG